MGFKLKIQKNKKGWIFTILIHAFLLFIFSNFGLKYKNPPDPKASVEIEIEAGGPESANNTDDINTEKKVEEKEEELKEEKEELKEEEKEEEKEEKLEDTEITQATDNTTITELTESEKEENRKKRETELIKKRVEKYLNKSEGEEWEWSPTIESQKSDGNWHVGTAKGENGTSFGIKGGAREATIPKPKGRMQIEKINQVLETGEFKIWIDIIVTYNGDVKKATINSEESTTGYHNHHKKRSEDAAMSAVFTSIDETKGDQKGYIIYIYRLTNKKGE